MLPEINAELSQEQIEQLELARKQIPKVKEAIRKAKLAGIDTSIQEKDLADLQAQLDKLYRVYVRGITTSSTS